jgi:hypothetical protein
MKTHSWYPVTHILVTGGGEEFFISSNSWYRAPPPPSVGHMCPTAPILPEVLCCHFVNRHCKNVYVLIRFFILVRCINLRENLSSLSVFGALFYKKLQGHMKRGEVTLPSRMLVLGTVDYW